MQDTGHRIEPIGGEAAPAVVPAAAPVSPDAIYARWITEYGTLTPEHRATALQAIARLPQQPLISVIMTGNGSAIGTNLERQRTLISLNAQLYARWEVLMPVGTSKPEAGTARVRHLATASFDGALRGAKGQYVVFVEAGDILPPHALALLLLAAPKGPCLVFSDEDEIEDDGIRKNPHFKIGWSPDLFLGQDYACRLAMVRTADALGRGRGMPARRAVYDLLLQISGTIQPSAIIHIPHVLYHRRAGIKLSDMEAQAMRRSVEEHAGSWPRRPGHPAPQVSNLAPGLHRVQWRLPVAPPRVSLLVPTRDRAELLRTCIDGLRFETDYPDLEILILDNGSCEPATHAYFGSLKSDRRIRVIASPGPFNYAAINNSGARHATGSLIGLLNNDMRIEEAGWLREMVSHALRPGIGAVGAMLWYADRTIQHAGVTLGIGGVASHLFKKFGAESPGYQNLLKLTRDVSAVTAACMVMPRAAWEEVGGLDEKFTVAYNDVDLCLRIRKAGYRVIWTPHARLYHLESASRGLEDSAEKRIRFDAEKGRMKNRWRALLSSDPFFSPNLSLKSTSCKLAFPSRAAYPWSTPEAP